MLEVISGIITTISDALVSVFNAIVGSVTGGAAETPEV